jgi:hypothetical protein
VLCHSSVRKLDHLSESRYRYLIELNMPGWMVSPLFWKSHMTAPHERAAKNEKSRASGGMGLICELALEEEAADEAA